MIGSGTELATWGAAVLVAGLAFAAFSDLKTREVNDRVWQILGLAGLGLGAAAYGSGGPVPFVVWIVVSVLVLEHTVPWDERLPERWQDFARLLEFGGYLVLAAGLALVAGWFGLGPSGVPIAAVAVVVTVVFARVLYELELLYGFADAKALMAAGLLVPICAHPWLRAPGEAGTVLAWMPFAITLLTNAALLSVAIPLGVAIHNLRRGEFSLRRGFTGYSLPVKEIPERYVWVKEPKLDEELEDRIANAETSAEDTRLRREATLHLLRLGVTRVWVTPQVPYVVLIALGTVAGLLAGNLVLDLSSAL